MLRLKALNSLYFSLLAGNPGKRRVRCRPRPPPSSLCFYSYSLFSARKIEIIFPRFFPGKEMVPDSPTIRQMSGFRFEVLLGPTGKVGTQGVWNVGGTWCTLLVEPEGQMEILNIEVVNNEAEQRFEVHLQGQTAFLAYRRFPDRLVLVHTEVPPALEGKGIAGKLVARALDLARAAHLRDPAVPLRNRLRSETS